MMSIQSQNASLPGITRRTGFTLVEMLIATAITLLMMAALARSFSFVSESVQESRANTGLASTLRDVTTRLSDELAMCTVNLQPNDGGPDQLGYFMYYEGPTTDATSSLFRADDTSGKLDLADGKYGDFDDYIAFTAVAPGNNWFTGKVPRYLLDMKTAQLNGTAFPPAPPYDPFEPVVIQSKYAEIIYFASPEYATDSLPANPRYIDVDGDLDLGSGVAIENGLPDRLRLHRRVLLIRPDLNLSDGMLPIQSDGAVRFMLPDAWPTAVATGPNATIQSSADPSLGWLYGMAAVHQQCDLSLRRVLRDDGSPRQRVAANSLVDLSKPHNRFAHVHAPVTTYSFERWPTVVLTSAPLLALGPAPTILSTPTSATPVARIAPPAISNVGPVVTPATLSGFLRPEFVLGNDLTHLDNSANSWGLQRIGEDLVTNHVLGFDVQIYDPEASFFRTSNGVLIGPSDPAYRQVIVQEIVPVAASNPNPPIPLDTKLIAANLNRERGGFVDLAYPVLAGGSLRGWQPRRLDRRSAANDAGLNPVLEPGVNFLSTPFSGLDNFDPTTANIAATVYDPFLRQSGKLIVLSNIEYFQPTFDTFTSYYERDGVQQMLAGQGLIPNEVGPLWWPVEPPSPTNYSQRKDFATSGVDRGIFESTREITPPFKDKPEAIRITIRIENPTVRLIRQASVEFKGKN